MENFFLPDGKNFVGFHPTYLLETDSPYLTPVPYRGKENRPSYVRFVADEIANLRGIEVDELKNITSQNAEKVFGLKRQ